MTAVKHYNNRYRFYFILGTVIGAALESKRNGLCLVSSDDDEFLIKRKLTKFAKKQ